MLCWKRLCAVPEEQAERNGTLSRGETPLPKGQKWHWLWHCSQALTVCFVPTLALYEPSK